ncbi:glycoside hydrolase family 9 protein [Marinimicrobium sp. ABcell2]|uniref:glycoside hydrolase family 9 protein n=1 Tax=Marinimicrobium sp. ABcell2 TaxID=3069751 RepID=UPI0027B5CAF9|nr:glycoside hydrolase family 9 protein [Marinimicrobium sp. ABcell2]MDQ2078133.1 glycoside hydrolase family 9 protein [Marinimicrobium sp. ABcell2]
MFRLKRTAKPWAFLAVALLGVGNSHVMGQDIDWIDSTFEDGKTYPWVNSSGWGTAADFDVNTSDGRMCVTVNETGIEAWNITFRVERLHIQAGETYTFSATLESDGDAAVNSFIAHEPPHAANWGAPVLSRTHALSAGSPETIEWTHSSTREYRGAYVGFHMGGGSLVPANTTICIGDVELKGPPSPYVREEEPVSPIQANQLGYIPGLAMRATYVLPEGADNTPRDWQLQYNGSRVDGGQTIPAGFDAGSGNQIQSIDFSRVELDVLGEGYRLVVDEGGTEIIGRSFAIANDLYDELRYDALAYFYMNRAGIEISADVVGEDLARPAGHLGDDAIQTLGCNPSIASLPQDHLDPAFLEECLTLDVSGGWYDAGDYGKYVVNGGISVWTLLNQYERFKHLSDVTPFGDGRMHLPADEQGDGLPDLLNEAKWQLDWIMKMQVPEGAIYEGMVYHKMHGDSWPGLPSYPHEDPSTRYVWPPSTAATLNFAAVGAQCYRIFREYPGYADFAQACLDRAVRAFDAAVTGPFLRSPPTQQQFDGGGAYEDNVLNPDESSWDHVEDERYWAATELYLATGDAQYAADMDNYAAHLQLDDGLSAFSWFQTDGLGVVSLATAGEAMSADPDWVAQARVAIQNTARRYAEETQNSYGLNFNAEEMYWGSNANIVNNMIVLGLAHDFSQCNPLYADAMQTSMSYLLGRNPMDISYVTGVGERPVQEPHHRVWANAEVHHFPEPPRGVMVGGPNMTVGDWEDDVAAQVLDPDCPPLTCYVDHIKAYAQNEVTINWNAPFAWAVAYMAELASDQQPASCDGDPLVALDGSINLDVTDSLDLRALNNGAAGDTYALDQGPTYGQVVITNGVATYTPSDDFDGNDSFTYVIVSAAGVVSDPARVSVTGSTVGVCQAPAWSPTEEYPTPGTVVSHNGAEYYNEWWINPDANEPAPDESFSWGPWILIGPCGGVQDPDQLGVSPSSLSFDVNGGTQSVNVTGNVSWVAESNAGWITVNNAQGSGAGSFTVTVSYNGGSERTGTITVTDGTLTQTVTVYQVGEQVGGACGYEVTYQTHEYHNKWNALLTIENTSGAVMNSWEVLLAYPDHTTLGAWGGPGTWDADVATLSGAGNQYRLTNKHWNGTLYPGDTLTIHLDGSSGPPPPGTPVVPAGIPEIRGPVCGN